MSILDDSQLPDIFHISAIVVEFFQSRLAGRYTRLILNIGFYHWHRQSAEAY